MKGIREGPGRTKPLPSSCTQSQLTVANESMKEVLTGGREKMSVAIMANRRLGLRNPIRFTGASRGSYYYVKIGRKDEGKLRDPSILSTTEELALKKPVYGTRRMAVMLSRELGRPINRKRVQRVYRSLR